jgi:hypothetical protein
VFAIDDPTVKQKKRISCHLSFGTKLQKYEIHEKHEHRDRVVKEEDTRSHRDKINDAINHFIETGR